jgi:tetratricopeptide (TPR) repeat protein
MATLLAHHWREAGEPARAVDYMVLGAERASRAWAKAEAVDLLTEALDLLEDAGMSERAAELRMLRGRAYTGLGDHANAGADLEAAIPNLEGVTQARALLDRARVALMMVNADDIKRFARAAGEAAARFSDPELQARALLAASNGAMVDGDLDEAVALTSRSIDDWPPHARAGDPDYASATMWLGLYSYWKGELEPAAERSQHAIDLGLEAQALEPTTQAMAHLALSLAGMGRGSDAIRWFDRSVSLGLEWEAVPRFSSRSMNMWAGAARESLLDLEEARRLSTEGGELARRAAFPPGIESSKVDLVILDLAEGDVGRAEVDFPRVWESAMGVKGIHHWLFLIRLLEAKAAIAVARGRAEEGIEAAQEARKEARALPRLKYVAHSSLTLGRCLAAAKRPDEAIPLFESALDVASRVPHRATEWRAAAALAGACYAAGEDDRAAEAAARARKVVETFAEGLEGESSTRFLAASEISEILALSS